MVKKIRLLGMVMDNFPLREEVLLGENFYSGSRLHIIRTVSMQMLSMAAFRQDVRSAIAQADLLIVADKEILAESGIYSRQRLREAVEHRFMHEYLQRIDRRRCRVFLAAQDYKKLEILQQYVSGTYEKIQIVGCYGLEECGGEYDMMVNEINAAAPDVLLSVMESPQEDAFLLASSAKIRAKVWYSLGGDFSGPAGKWSFSMWFQKLIYKERFKNIIHHYEGINGN